MDCALFDKFEAYGFRTLEMLINFNSFGFFRDACRVMKVGYKHDEALRNLDDLVEYELADYSKENEYGITLISLNESYRERIEPCAALYQDRLSALKALHDKGYKTWVSVEPYPTPNLIEQDLKSILVAVAFTDKIIFGRTNYSKEISEYTAHRAFYNEQAELVIAFCSERNIQFHIKDGTISKQKESRAQTMAKKNKAQGAIIREYSLELPECTAHGGQE